MHRNVLTHVMDVIIAMDCVILAVCLAGVVISAINVLVFSILYVFRHFCDILTLSDLVFNQFYTILRTSDSVYQYVESFSF